LSATSDLLGSIGLAISAHAGLLLPWLLPSSTFLIGYGNALHNPSWQSLVGHIVPKEGLPLTVALDSVGFNMMRSADPAIGGVIVAVAVAGFATGLGNGPCSITWKTPTSGPKPTT
jgi:uncharacterized protein (DUF697 family)